MEMNMLIDEKYEVISKIKRGGFGIIYYGYDRKFEKPIAIKAIDPNLLQEAKYIDMFLEEAKNAAKLNHNNIVHVYDLIKSDNGEFYIIMEYIDGVDLQRVLKKCRAKGISIPLKLSVYIIKEVCKALEYAHNKRDLITNEPMNLVHQDISPSNIMIAANGTVKLIDFGIAGIKFNRNGNSRQITITGKLPYMAPEQLNGTLIDRRADIFSLGTVFYELLTNERLFDGETDEKIIEAIKRGRVSHQELEQKKVPQSVQKILVKALQRNVNDRYQGANNVYIELVEYLMTTVESVELSAELGEFVLHLFDEEKKEKSASSSLPESPAPAPAPVETRPEQAEIVEPPVEASNEKQVDATEPVEVTKPQEQVTEEETTEQASEDIEQLEQELESIQADLETSSSTDEPIDLTPVEQENDTDVDERTDDIPTGETVVLTESEQAEVPDEVAEPAEETVPQQEEGDDEIARLEAELQQANTAELDIESELPPADDDAEDETPESHESSSSKTFVVDPASIGKFKPVMTEAMEEEEEGEDDIKTVIDVIRLSAQTHRKSLIWGSIGVGAFLVLFMILNVMFGWTATGRAIYDRVWQPAIRIYTAPQGAKVYIDGKEIEGQTPISIPKIAPGLHKLTLTYPGYQPLSRTLQVPSKGQLKVDGEKSRKGYEPYVFRFKSQFELMSNPPGATIYINNIKYNQKTPTVLEWEVGVPLKIDMTKPGFEELTGFSYNTLEDIAEIEDNRLWSFTKVDGDVKKYMLKGLFKRFVKISSVPTNTAFYLDGASSPTGRTGDIETIALSVGKHDLLFSKPGFNSKRVTVNVDETGPASIFAMLSRNVRIFAKEASGVTDNDIGAKIVRIYREGRSYVRNVTTPCEISLPPVEHQIMFRKAGYKDAVAVVKPTQRVVVIRMEPEKVDIEVLITDALSGLPLANATVYCLGINGETDSEITFGVTNEEGLCSQTLIPGQYTFRVRKNRYFEKTANVSISQNQRLNLKLIIQ